MVNEPVECKNASFPEGYVQGETRVGMGFCPKCGGTPVYETELLRENGIAPLGLYCRCLFCGYEWCYYNNF